VDTYSYTPNAGLPPGHTALLDAVALAGGAGGTRDYTFGPAGHLELLDAGANVLDFGNDVVGQLASVTRTAEHSASFRYDGRGFLREIVTLEPGSGGGGGDLPFLDGFETGDPCEWSAVVGYPGPACPIPPVETRTFVTYDSQGRLRALQPESGDPSYVFTFGDRPIATYTGGPMPSFTWLTTDHLGTPILAIDNAGTALWHGGFEPFGQDYTNPTAASAGVFLRFPGQWTASAWTDAALGTELYYNLHRWYETGTGRYAARDPIGLKGGINPFIYARSSPLRFLDPSGERLIPMLCDATQSARIQGAEAQIRDATQRCVTCEDRTLINGLLDQDLQVTCVPQELVDEVGPLDLCGGTSGGEILITPAGFHSPERCGCLESVVFHELFHLIGGEESPTRTQTRQCFGCAQPAPQDPFSP